MQESLLQHIQKVWQDYEIGDKIGAGSYAEVYRAVRKNVEGTPGIGDYAAVKIIEIPKNEEEIEALLSAYGNDIDVRAYYEAVANKYMQEVRTMQALDGRSNIVEIKDYRCLKKQHTIGWGICILMELLTPLTKYVRNETLDESEVIKLGLDICTALEECEKRQIIHRDIKPDNLFVDFHGNFKLGDFGVARTLSDLTNGMSQKGTPNYWAPEIAVGADYNSTADLYSLGIVLYQMMNNKHLPFVGPGQTLNPSSSQEALDRRLRGEPIPPPVNASPALKNVIMKACAFDPKYRFQSASEMKRALLAARDNPNSAYFPAAAAAGAAAGERTAPVAGRPGTDQRAENRQNAQQPPVAPPVYQPPQYQEPAPAAAAEPEEEKPARGGKKGLKVFLILLAALLAVALLVFAGILIVKSLQNEDDDDDEDDKVTVHTTDDVGLTETPVPSVEPEITLTPELTEEPEPSEEPTAEPTPTADPMAYYAYGLDVGHSFAVALRSDGTVAAAGKNDTVKNAVSGWRDIVQLAAGWDFALGLTSDGRVLFAGPETGTNARIDRSAIANWRDVVFISANACACAAIDRNGNILLSGGPQDQNDTTLYSLPANIYAPGKPISVSVGVFHILVLYENGTVRAIYNTYGDWCRVDSWANIVQIAAGERGSTGLSAFGTVLYAGLTNHNQSEYYGHNGIVSIASKGWHLCMVYEDGTVETVGYNGWGQCSTDGFNGASGKHVIAIATSGWTTAVLFDDGTVSIVGSSDSISPSEVAKWRNIVRTR